MSLRVEFVGDRVRPFLQLLSHCCRMCDALHIEPHSQTLRLRAINRTKSTHLELTLQPAAISKYSYVPPTTGGGDVNNNALTIESKSLVNSILRQSSSIVKLVLTHNSQVDSENVCSLVAHVYTARGMRRKYALQLDDTPPLGRADCGTDGYGFEAICEPKVWSSFLMSLPMSTSRLSLAPSATRMSIKGNSEVDPDAGKGVVASIDRRHFPVFRFNPTGPASAALAQQQQQQQGASPYTAPGGSSGDDGPTICGKTMEQKAVRHFATFVEQLQMQLRIMIGGPGAPVVLEACSLEVPSPLVQDCVLLIAASDCELPAGALQGAVDHQAPRRPTTQISALGPTQSRASLLGDRSFIMDGGSSVTPQHQQQGQQEDHQHHHSMMNSRGSGAAVSHDHPQQYHPQHQHNTSVASSSPGAGGGAVAMTGITPESMRKRPRDSTTSTAGGGMGSYHQQQQQGGGDGVSPGGVSHVSMSADRSMGGARPSGTGFEGTAAAGGDDEHFARGLFPLDFAALAADDDDAEEEEDDGGYQAFLSNVYGAPAAGGGGPPPPPLGGAGAATYQHQSITAAGTVVVDATQPRSSADGM